MKHRKDLPGDRRVRRTRRQLHDALISLILERGWDKVSVLDVCDRADIGRSTFYVHFADKEELLLSGLEDLHAYMDELRARATGTLGFAEALVEHAQENLRLFRALVGKKGGPQVLRAFRDVVIRLVEADLASLGVPVEERPLAARYIAGGFVELLTTWLDRPSKIEAKTLAGTFRRLTASVLETWGGRERVRAMK
jgi:AcrR family transcriptional regulator